MNDVVDGGLMLQVFENEHWTSLMYLNDNVDDFAASDLFLEAAGTLFSDGLFTYEQVATTIAVHVIESGAGQFTVDGVTFHANAGDLFSFFPGKHYRYQDAPASPWRYEWFRLGGSRAMDTMRTLGVTPSTPHVSADLAPTICPLIRQAAQGYAATSSPLFHGQAAAWGIVGAIAKAMGAPAATDAPRNVEDAAKRLMDDDFTTGITVDEIARRLGVTRSTLFRLFRRRYHVSPKAYLDTVRLDRARRLLRGSATPIHEIAALCGYEDPHYFSRAYRRARGLSPSEERCQR